MVIYVDKSGVQLGVGYIETGTPPTGNWFDVDHVDSLAWRVAEARHWKYPLGVTLTDADDVWFKIKFMKEIDFTFVPINPQIVFSLLNTPAFPYDSNLGVFYDAWTASIYGIAKPHVGAFQNCMLGVLLAETGYYMVGIFNSATRRLSVEIRLQSDDSLVYSGGINLAPADTYIWDTIGIANCAWDAENSHFIFPWEITYIKANSGITEESSSTRHPILKWPIIGPLHKMPLGEVR